MKTTITIIISLFIFQYSEAQVSECSCQAFFNWDTIKKSGFAKDKLYSSIARLDTLNDDGCDAIVLIKKDSGEYFSIIPFPDIPTKRLPLTRIKKHGQLASNTWPVAKKLFVLYEKPDSNSSIVYRRVYEGFGKDDKLLVILGCQGNWIKVSVNFNGEKHIGWKDEHFICSWPCMSCN